MQEVFFMMAYFNSIHAYYNMESSIRRKNRAIEPLITVTKQRQTQKLQYPTASSSPFGSLDNSFLGLQDLESAIINDRIRDKASFLLSVPVSPRDSACTDKNSDRNSKLSLMFVPRKKITITDLTESLRRKKRLTRLTHGREQKQNKFYKSQSNSNFYGEFKENRVKLKCTKIQEEQSQNGKSKTQQQMKMSNVSFLNQYKQTKSFFSASDYFQLVFSKMLSKPGKQKIFILLEDLMKRYEKYPSTISQDVEDIQSIAQKLKLALGPKQKYVELRPFQALEVNGELARLVFHLTHEITARKYKNYDLIKIYKEIQYCSRRLELHKFTMKVCFELGELYKQKSDEVNSHNFYSKALKLAIFLNDRFHQQKAIDCFGLTAYNSNKSGQAFYFHENVDKLNGMQRDLIKQKYSNAEQIQKISNDKQKEMENQSNNKNKNGKANSENKIHCTIMSKRKQTFNFNGTKYVPDFDWQNKKNFKQKISKYIQCPIMRANILVARTRIGKIEKIGQIQRYKNFETSRAPMRFNEDLQSSSQVLLTHRSLNRRNPDIQNRVIEKQRKVLLELINYYTNENVV